MKFDSYTRFLKSPLYQECILAEVEGRTLPDPQRVPSSPTSKHSISSEKSNISTPKKVTFDFVVIWKLNALKYCFSSSLKSWKTIHKNQLECLPNDAGKY